MVRRNQRRHTRKPFAATIRVGWQDSRGTDKSALTRSFDISESGMSFELWEPLLIRADVSVRGDKLGLQARATVRCCAPKGSKYSIGVEFACGYRWKAPNEDVRRALEEAEMLVV